MLMQYVPIEEQSAMTSMPCYFLLNYAGVPFVVPIVLMRVFKDKLLFDG